MGVKIANIVMHHFLALSAHGLQDNDVDTLNLLQVNAHSNRNGNGVIPLGRNEKRTKEQSMREATCALSGDVHLTESFYLYRDWNKGIHQSPADPQQKGLYLMTRSKYGR